MKYGWVYMIETATGKRTVEYLQWATDREWLTGSASNPTRWDKRYYDVEAAPAPEPMAA